MNTTAEGATTMPAWANAAQQLAVARSITTTRSRTTDGSDLIAGGGVSADVRLDATHAVIIDSVGEHRLPPEVADALRDLWETLREPSCPDRGSRVDYRRDGVRIAVAAALGGGRTRAQLDEQTDLRRDALIAALTTGSAGDLPWHCRNRGDVYMPGGSCEVQITTENAVDSALRGVPAYRVWDDTDVHPAWSADEAVRVAVALLTDRP